MNNEEVKEIFLRATKRILQELNENPDNLFNYNNLLEKYNNILKEYIKLKKENKCQKRIIDNALIISDWECKDSPVGVCIYSIADEDYCLFCGEPYERK